MIVWLTQSVSVIGSALTVFAINIYLAQVLYPAPEQKPELALAITAFNWRSRFPSCSARRWRARGPIGTTASAR